jgi:hypothetical protein
MAIVCPHCRHGMSVKDAKPGKYKPKCAKCGERFVLTIFGEAGSEPLVEKLPEAAVATASATMAASPHETLAASAPAAAVATSTAAKTQAGNVDATLAPDINSTSAWVAPAVPSARTVPQRAMEVTAPAASEQATRAETRSVAGSAGLPATIDGYRIVRELGRGAMGAVYLARQNSLDREVALKTIQSQWASNPIFIARFTREAYAAAQLTHHNVVQIYDLGADHDVHFFSMEFVRGQSLDDLVKQQGKLDPEVAVGYILQAARGLEFAHRNGMVHRDVKPANLMLNEHGIVKVADLGLVKTPELAAAEEAAEKQSAPATGTGTSLSAATASVTMAGMAMGTPAYMAPEQAENAAGVDHRADIYSLGCTLYVLLTGRPPFEGASALEVITKHRSEPIVRPEAIVRRVPAALSEITLKMVAKRPEDRYANLGEAIRALEGFMGISSSGPFSPSEEHAAALEKAAEQFHAAKAARLRTPLILGLVGVTGLLFLLGLAFSWKLAAGSLCLVFAALATYFVASGLGERTVLFAKCRQLLATFRWTDWLTWLAGALLLALVLQLVGWFGMCLGLGIFGMVIGLAWRFGFDRWLATERRASLDSMEEVLKSLRLKGVDEAALQQFVCKYSGTHWEEFFEALFGYEAKLAARQQWGADKGRPRPKFRAWRDGLIRLIDARVAAHRQAKDRAHLQKIEEKNLQAQGLDLITARRKARHVADALVDEAAEAKVAAQQAAAQPAATPADPALAVAKKRAKIKTMLAEARGGAYDAKARPGPGAIRGLLNLLLGGRVRFLLGCLLLVGCALWARQNGLFTRERAEQVGQAVTTSVQERNASALAGQAAKIAEEQPSLKTLNIPLVGPYVSSLNAAVAGMVLVVLGLFRGWKMSLFALPAAAIMVLGPQLGIPEFLQLGSVQLSSLTIGLLLAAAGVFFGRTYDDYTGIIR